LRPAAPDGSSLISARVTDGLVGAGTRGLGATLSIEELGLERRLELKARGVPFVYTMWHGRMFVPALALRGQGIVTMASRSKDGEIITRWMRKNGYLTVRGSTGKGGARALLQMIACVRDGHPAVMTVDGPRGPARVVAPGILPLARKTGAWILPVGSSSTRPVFLRSWDRYLLPKPFSRCVVTYGKPFTIPAAGDDQTQLARIGEALDAATREADRAVGVSPPPPWGPA
jgi:hypothetical protein